MDRVWHNFTIRRSRLYAWSLLRSIKTYKQKNTPKPNTQNSYNNERRRREKQKHTYNIITNPKMAISNIHLTHSFARSNHIKLVFATIVIIYFAWMDIALYMNLQRWTPPPPPSSSSSSSSNQLEAVRIYQHQVDNSNNVDSSLNDPHHSRWIGRRQK